MTKVHHEVNGTKYVFDEATKTAWCLSDGRGLGLFFESYCPEVPGSDREWNILPGWTLKAEGDAGRREFAKVLR